MYRQLNTLRRHKWKLVICLGAARECSGVLLPHYLRLPFFRLMMEMHFRGNPRMCAIAPDILCIVKFAILKNLFLKVHNWGQNRSLYMYEMGSWQVLGFIVP